MAEITTNVRQPRVDMTPMVDLGFLLITFFVFTTTFSSPTIMPLNVPDNAESIIKPPIKTSNTLTFILAKNNRLFWHQNTINKLKFSDLKEVMYNSELSHLIINKRNNAPKPENFTVIIHPSNESNYKNTVDILDEMVISNQKKYVLDDISSKEENICQILLK